MGLPVCRSTQNERKNEGKSVHDIVRDAVWDDLGRRERWTAVTHVHYSWQWARHGPYDANPPGQKVLVGHPLYSLKRWFRRSREVAQRERAWRPNEASIEVHQAVYMVLGVRPEAGNGPEVRDESIPNVVYTVRGIRTEGVHRVVFDDFLQVFNLCMSRPRQT